MTPLALAAQRTALLVVDIQDRLAAAMLESVRQACERNTLVLLEAARRLSLPVVVSEQYPKGLGRTVPAIEEALRAPGLRLERFEKMEFSCAAAPAFRPVYERIGRAAWVVCGMETHICVYQSARGLLEWGAAVHVPRDAVASRTPENLGVGLSLIEKAGGVVTSTETVVFDLLGRAGSDDFRALSRLIK